MDGLTRAKVQHGIREQSPAARLMLERADILAGVDRLAVDCEQDVPACNSRERRRRLRRDFDRADAFGTDVPEHAVFDLVDSRACRNVGEAQNDEHHRDRDRGNRPNPGHPRRLDATRTRIRVGFELRRAQRPRWPCFEL